MERTEGQASGDALGNGESDHPRTEMHGERLRNSELQELIVVAGVLDRKAWTCEYARLSSFREADSMAVESH